MLKRCIAAENRKLHRSPIWLLFFVMPLISASYGTFNYLQNLYILAAGAYGPQLEFNYGRPRTAAGSVFGQVLRGV